MNETKKKGKLNGFCLCSNVVFKVCFDTLVRKGRFIENDILFVAKGIACIMQFRIITFLTCGAITPK